MASDVWFACTVSGPGHRSLSRDDIVHGTRNGIRTLCGAAVFIDNREIEFDPANSHACKRCVRGVVRRRGYGYENGQCVECGATDGGHYRGCLAVD